jgi:hypothetical protein
MRRPLTLFLSTAAIAVTGIALATPALASPAAPSDTTVGVTYPVTGSTFIKAIDSTIALGPGTLSTTTVNFSTNAVTTTATETIKLTSLKVAGLPIPVGGSCQTSPTAITVSSQPGFNVLGGGTLAGSYTIPRFSHCGLATFVINLTLPGPGNTISLTLGAGTLG